MATTEPQIGEVRTSLLIPLRRPAAAKRAELTALTANTPGWKSPLARQLKIALEE
jgi:hypothetical protein